MLEPQQNTPSICAVKTPCLGPKLSGGAGAEPLPAAAAADILDHLQTSSRDPVTVGNFAFYRDCLEHSRDDFQHSGWHTTRMRVFDAMEATDVPIARAIKFCGCGDDTYIYQNSESGEIDYHGSRCGDRFCLICGQARSHRIARSLSHLIEAEQPLFLTFTVRGKPGDSLASMIDRLSNAWKELRRLKHWKENIRGGAIMLEVKYSTESGGHWHPHYHLLAHGNFIKQEWLRQAWHVITRDSDQVDIQRVDDLRKAMGYVTKYASKPMDGSYLSKPHLLREAMRTLKGRRLCACFGTWYGTPLNDSPEEDDDGTEVLTAWRYLGSARDLACKAERGDTHARDVLAAVERTKRLRHSLDLRRRSTPEMRGPPETDPPGELFTGDAA